MCKESQSKYYTIDLRSVDGEQDGTKKNNKVKFNLNWDEFLRETQGKSFNIRMTAFNLYQENGLNDYGIDVILHGATPERYICSDAFRSGVNLGSVGCYLVEDINDKDDVAENGLERPTGFTLNKNTQWQRVNFEKNTWYIELLCSTKDDSVGLALNPESGNSLPAPVGQEIDAWNCRIQIEIFD